MEHLGAVSLYWLMVMGWWDGQPGTLWHAGWRLNPHCSFSHLVGAFLFFFLVRSGCSQCPSSLTTCDRPWHACLCWWTPPCYHVPPLPSGTIKCQSPFLFNLDFQCSVEDIDTFGGCFTAVFFLKLIQLVINPFIMSEGKQSHCQPSAHHKAKAKVIGF